jgi:cytochrome c553
MKNSRIRYVYILFGIIMTALMSCARGRNITGWDFFPDMFYSTAYETYSENQAFKDSMTMRVPVEGTIPRNFIPFEFTTEADSRKKAGDELRNPFEPISNNIDRGKAAYTTFCVGCHGEKGYGDGRLFTMKLYPMKPRPVAGQAAAPLRDGEIYHTITLGFGSMGAHGSQVRPDDRWKIVLYIRELQKEAESRGE